MTIHAQDIVFGVPVRRVQFASRQLDRRDKFVAGPIPLRWLTPASKLPGKALHVAMALRFLVGVERSSKVRLSRSALSRFGVDRHSTYRALHALEPAGLVLVERHRGRNPIVTIIDEVPERSAA